MKRTMKSDSKNKTKLKQITEIRQDNDHTFKQNTFLRKNVSFLISFEFIFIFHPFIFTSRIHFHFVILSFFHFRKINSYFM
jgi:hypothetical protein